MRRAQERIGDCRHHSPGRVHRTEGRDSGRATGRNHELSRPPRGSGCAHLESGHRQGREKAVCRERGEEAGSGAMVHQVRQQASRDAELRATHPDDDEAATGRRGSARAARAVQLCIGFLPAERQAETGRVHA